MRDKALDGEITLEVLWARKVASGFMLDVAPGTEGKILISFGFLEGPEAGDGGQWVVEFLEKDEVIGAVRVGRPTEQMGALGLRLLRRW